MSAFITIADAATTLARQVQATVVHVRSRGGSGSGIIWRADGQVVTNHHVAPTDRAEIETADGRRFPAHVEARDPSNDLAILMPDVPLSGLPTAQVGDSTRLRVGQLVIAVGNPFGMKGAVTIGIISQAAPPRPGQRELIRANIVLQPGNSGGPLVDAAGRVIGVNAMVTGPGSGLAVPVHLVCRLVAATTAPRLGIVGRDVELGPLARWAGLEKSSAVILTEVAAGYPADRAGLLPGDIVIGLNGQPITASREMVHVLSTRRPADPVWFRVLRGGQLRDVIISPTAA
ncbi:MAG: trypsin-like peptidase domain-containing protein [Chloroflexota bacterium]|nr:S1C family serine protease [Dehalococcoidia bacterium]MDW8255134.1 trypsin-like peptidase domain-containing protein [Chloroflexota bacterium]